MMIRMGNRIGNRTAIHTSVDGLFSYRKEIRIAIRFAANRTGIRAGNPIRVDGPLVVWEKICISNGKIHTLTQEIAKLCLVALDNFCDKKTWI
jgi:hypothetical protein